jgi:hypothetical protein
MINQFREENAERPTPNSEYRIGTAATSDFDIGRWTLGVRRFPQSFL